MANDPRLPLQHMLQAIEWIEADTNGLDFERFAADRRKRQLVERNLEVISEASRRVSANLLDQHPDISWREIAGIGNVLRHDYHEVVPTILWSIVEKDLSSLKQAVEAMLKTVADEPNDEDQ